MSLEHGVMLSRLLMVHRWHMVITVRTSHLVFTTIILKLLSKASLPERQRCFDQWEALPGEHPRERKDMLHASFKKAKEEGISIAIHWQDADSSSSNAMIEHFTDAEIMICGGQAGRLIKSNWKSLLKSNLSQTSTKKHCERFPRVDSVACHCEKPHTSGCGCLSVASIKHVTISPLFSRTVNLHTNLLKLWKLPRHACDEGMEGSVFYALKLCSCGKCKDNVDLKCDGKDYHETDPQVSYAYFSL